MSMKNELSDGDRRNLQDLYETGLSPRELSEKMEKTVTVIYTELRRGRDGTRLEDGRLKYDATVAQRVVWTTGEVTIQAGETVTVTARYQKEPSYDFACVSGGERQNLRHQPGRNLKRGGKGYGKKGN